MISGFEKNKKYIVNTDDLPPRLSIIFNKSKVFKCYKVKNFDLFCCIEPGYESYIILYTDFKYFDYYIDDGKDKQEEMEL